ncbi:MAG: hypothetical protein ABSB86_03285 [Bryobacteraceae bacterium]|jgi:hypothetical protein
MRKLFAPLFLFTMALAVPAMADNIVYDSLPSPTPYSVPSVGFEALSASEFGQGVQLQGNTGATLTSATVLMDNWAMESQWPTVGTSAGYNVPLTLNLYNVGADDTVGSLIATDTISALIQWQPAYSTSSACQTIDNAPGGYANQAWLAPDNNCYFGLAQTVTFSLANIAVPGQFIWGLAFNTETAGYDPTGVAGPYDSLNLGLNSNPDGTDPFSPSVGSDLVAGSLYWNTSYAGFYTNPSATPGVFQQDTDWAPYDPAIAFSAATAVPEPSLLWPVGLGFVCLIAVRYKFHKQAA